MSERASIMPEYVKEILDAFNRRDVDAIVGFFTDDAEWLLARGPEPCGRRLVGKEQIRELLETRFEMIPDMRWVDSKSWIHGNQAVSEWRVQGTTTTGEKIDWLGCDLWEFRDGKIAKKDTYWKYVEKE
ncbi:MAG: nuclear transport factor 2 family protein [Alphaproteobacteria bacterium]